MNIYSSLHILFSPCHVLHVQFIPPRGFNEHRIREEENEKGRSRMPCTQQKSSPFLGATGSITQVRILITFLHIYMSHLHVQLHNPFLFFYCVFMLEWQDDDEKKEEGINSFLLINHR